MLLKKVGLTAERNNITWCKIDDKCYALSNFNTVKNRIFQSPFKRVNSPKHWLFTIFMGQPVCWRFGRRVRKNSGPVNFAPESPRLRFCTIHFHLLKNSCEGLKVVSKMAWRNETRISRLEHSVPEQWRTRLPFQNPKSRLSFTFQTDFLETFCKWYGNNYCLIITGRSAFQSFNLMQWLLLRFTGILKVILRYVSFFKFRFVFFIFCPRRCFTVFTLWFYLFLNFREKFSNA